MYDSIEPILDEEDIKLDWNGLIDDSNTSVMSIDYINNDTEPTKQTGHYHKTDTGAMQNSLRFPPFNTKNPLFSSVVLRPDNATNSTSNANDLFQVTNNMRRGSVGRKKSQFDIFGTDNDEDAAGWGYETGHRLNNDKVDKMVEAMGLQYGPDYEMDDQLRTRFYKGRFNKPEHDSLDVSLSSYLDEDKENLSPYPDPLKTVKNKEANSIKKSNKVFFRSPRRNQKTAIPILKPQGTSIHTSEFRKDLNFAVKRDPSPEHEHPPRRICIPQHRTSTPLKPSIKYTESKPSIYMVNSSTGSINDATKFGTELNASSGDDFPLPEDANEIVQIPTNDEKSKVQKMAIIKVLANKFFHRKDAPADKRLGFYTSKEYGEYNGTAIRRAKEEKKQVKWAETLEW